ncbi:hypothetical protein FB567DRAFT_514446 [Paraphoma chrysanthemicola]|uniref:Uncharacterized protein n=1 Tax=Paraphoma chrysanthemicola TaxID=798071 RepID=A0A8K0RGT8_9PLEO|nr:hypothetical protein FB567DRAFT_514446 [Paraphoma chrysanthemicola]
MCSFVHADAWFYIMPSRWYDAPAVSSSCRLRPHVLLTSILLLFVTSRRMLDDQLSYSHWSLLSLQIRCWPVRSLFPCGVSLVRYMPRSFRFVICHLLGEKIHLISERNQMISRGHYFRARYRPGCELVSCAFFVHLMALTIAPSCPAAVNLLLHLHCNSNINRFIGSHSRGFEH